ncbi:hypothetical protein [Cyanobium sp. CH-040]|uniref:hypothetical protein n=1 Tax=Cyanobium sp. CH-040 TaxID=2823708 RepID=UPI0020CFB283|nr:hypothetical protein [Cyanobium sp. CH-040]MCP9928025.1 hypothetical protein [Cyanobium sp. CH-040]
MAATFGPPEAEEKAWVLINGASDSSIDSLCSAVSADIGMPAGRVRKVVMAILRLQQGILPPAAAMSDAEAAEPDPAGLNGRLRWYPLGANGRLRPGLHEQAPEWP